MMHQMQFIMFMKNVSMLGGAMEARYTLTGCLLRTGTGVNQL
jgi:hypothetical protein